MVETHGIRKTAAKTAADFGTDQVSIRNFDGDTIVAVRYRKKGGEATILVQIIEFDWSLSSSDAWRHVKFGLEVSDGSPVETIAKKAHAGHVFQVDHGGKEMVILTDISTIADGP